MSLVEPEGQDEESAALEEEGRVMEEQNDEEDDLIVDQEGDILSSELNDEDEDDGDIVNDNPEGVN